MKVMRAIIAAVLVCGAYAFQGRYDEFNDDTMTCEWWKKFATETKANAALAMYAEWNAWDNNALGDDAANTQYWFKDMTDPTIVRRFDVYANMAQKMAVKTAWEHADRTDYTMTKVETYPNKPDWGYAFRKGAERFGVDAYDGKKDVPVSIWVTVKANGDMCEAGPLMTVPPAECRSKDVCVVDTAFTGGTAVTAEACALNMDGATCTNGCTWQLATADATACGLMTGCHWVTEQDHIDNMKVGLPIVTESTYEECPGCVTFAFSQRTDDPSLFTIREVYTSGHAFVYHLGSDKTGMMRQLAKFDGGLNTIFMNGGPVGAYTIAAAGESLMTATPDQSTYALGVVGFAMPERMAVGTILRKDALGVGNPANMRNRCAADGVSKLKHNVKELTSAALMSAKANGVKVKKISVVFESDARLERNKMTAKKILNTLYGCGANEWDGEDLNWDMGGEYARKKTAMPDAKTYKEGIEGTPCTNRPYPELKKWLAPGATGHWESLSLAGLVAADGTSMPFDLYTLYSSPHNGFEYFYKACDYRHWARIISSTAEDDRVILKIRIWGRWGIVDPDDVNNQTDFFKKFTGGSIFNIPQTGEPWGFDGEFAFKFNNEGKVKHMDFVMDMKHVFQDLGADNRYDLGLSNLGEMMTTGKTEFGTFGAVTSIVQYQLNLAGCKPKPSGTMEDRDTCWSYHTKAECDLIKCMWVDCDVNKSKGIVASVDECKTVQDALDLYVHQAPTSYNERNASGILYNFGSLGDDRNSGHTYTMYKNRQAYEAAKTADTCTGTNDAADCCNLWGANMMAGQPMAAMPTGKCGQEYYWQALRLWVFGGYFDLDSPPVQTVSHIIQV